VIVDMKARCWVLTPALKDSDGNDLDWHWHKAEDAAETLRDRLSEVRHDGKPREAVELSYTRVVQHDIPCALLTCDGCNATLENDEIQGDLHLSARDEPTMLRDFLLDAGWSWDDSGHHHCADCPPLPTEIRRPGPHDVPLFGDTP
jgi:hypothetical protein